MRGFAGTLMRSVLLLLSALLVLVVIADVAVSDRQSEASAPIAREPLAVANILPTPSHRLVGIGASGAWWSSPVYALGASVRHEVGALLYSSRGLDLSQFRFNLGGGGVGVSTPWKAPPSFYLPNGSFNFRNNPSAVYFLEQAKRMGVKDLVGFVNSAPVQFTSNHRNCGGRLIASDIPAYAHTLAEEVRGLSTTFGVRLAYLSPMNEPAGSQAACRQEGMAVPVSERGPLIVALYQQLQALAPWCKIIADESSFVREQFLGQAPIWTSYPGVKKDLSALAFHGYDFPSRPTLRKVASFSHQVQLPVWATEICCYDGGSFGYQYDPTMNSGMWLANTIYNDLMVANASVFDWWIALSPDSGCNPEVDPRCYGGVNVLGRNDGLIYFDLSGATNGDHRLYRTKRYFVLGNFSRYLRPGAELFKVATSDRRIAAIAAIKGTTETVVVIDQTPAGQPPLPLQLEFPPGTGRIHPVLAVSTSTTASLTRVPLPTMTGEVALVLSQPESVTTYVFHRQRLVG
ncbi:MAG: glycoside hydrolase [Ferrimicrobium sp.]